MATNPHDPGADAAAATFDGSEDVAANPFDAPNGGSIRIGTASWTDPTMTAAGVFYPTGADSAEERLQYYASRFPLVEVDATYYSLPVRRTSELWVAAHTARLHVRHQGPCPDDRPADRDQAAAEGPPRSPTGRGRREDSGSTPRTCPTTSRTTSGRGSPTGSNHSPRPASWARSCSSTRAGSSPPRRTGTPSRMPSIGCARSA